MSDEPKNEVALVDNAIKEFSPKQSMASLPAHLQVARASGAASGMEWLMPEDLVFSRVKVTQSGDPYAKERGPDNKLKANPGDLWHKTKGEVYTPFGQYASVVPIKVQREFLHWAPRKDGAKGPKAKSTDPKSEIARKCAEAAAKARDGTAVKDDSVETFNESHSWLLWDLDRQEAYIVSFARGNIAESSSCLSDIRTKGIPMQGYIFALEAFDKKAKPPNPNYNAARFRHIGWAPPTVYERLAKVANDMAGKDFASKEPEDDDFAAPGGVSGTSAQDLA